MVTRELKCQMFNVNLYSALSLKTSNALYTLIPREQERLQLLSKNVSNWKAN